MIEKKVEISPSCHLVLTKWEITPDWLELEYTEHATSHGSSDSITTVSIDKETASNMIELLKEAYGI
jgi:ribosome biogenesis SPOUT family RNA methylase Rps3